MGSFGRAGKARSRLSPRFSEITFQLGLGGKPERILVILAWMIDVVTQRRHQETEALASNTLLDTSWARATSALFVKLTCSNLRNPSRIPEDALSSPRDPRLRRCELAECVDGAELVEAHPWLRGS